jgi:hypothetical protein
VACKINKPSNSSDNFKINYLIIHGDDGSGALVDVDGVQPVDGVDMGEPGALQKHNSTRECVEFLARVCFSSWHKTIIFFLPGKWAVVTILAWLVGRPETSHVPGQPIARLDTGDNTVNVWNNLGAE